MSRLAYAFVLWARTWRALPEDHVMKTGYDIILARSAARIIEGKY